ncbi:hypothetical protein [Brevundimonas sp. FT23042]|uniref:hypothetical protein n=1 Tax=Brevundimonas sp. FT23042 TaxID=3393749 RepID=UPI003B588D5A
MRKLTRLAGVALIALTGCGPLPEERTETPPPPPAEPRFEGRLASGSPADARASGFTVCAEQGAGYYGFVCENPEATLLGVKPFRALVRLSYPSDLAYDAPRRPEETRYQSLEFQFLQQHNDWKDDCDYQPANPYACYEDQTGPLPSVTRALEAQGWLGRSNRAGVQFVKPGVPFMISIGSRAFRIEGDPERRLAISIDVSPVEDEERDAVIAAIREAASARSARAEQNEAFIAAMGAPGADRGAR